MDLAVFPHKNKIRNTHLICFKFQTSPTCLKELQIKYFYIGTFSKIMPYHLMVFIWLFIAVYFVVLHVLLLVRFA